MLPNRLNVIKNKTPNTFENFSQRVLRHGEDEKNFLLSQMILNCFKDIKWFHR